MENRNLPNATLILILGILSIIGCCFYSVGFIIAIIALVMAGKATKLYKLNPEAYDNYGTVKTGKIFAIIGLVVNIIALLMVVWAIAEFGWEAFTNQEELRRLFEERYGR